MRDFRSYLLAALSMEANLASASGSFASNSAGLVSTTSCGGRAFDRGSYGLLRQFVELPLRGTPSVHGPAELTVAVDQMTSVPSLRT